MVINIYKISQRSLCHAHLLATKCNFLTNWNYIFILCCRSHALIKISSKILVRRSEDLPKLPFKLATQNFWCERISNAPLCCYQASWWKHFVKIRWVWEISRPKRHTSQIYTINNIQWHWLIFSRCFSSSMNVFVMVDCVSFVGKNFFWSKAWPIGPPK